MRRHMVLPLETKLPDFSMLCGARAAEAATAGLFGPERIVAGIRIVESTLVPPDEVWLCGGGKGVRFKL
jgi:hypothetical protein